jgi:hypothetical protein
VLIYVFFVFFYVFLCSLYCLFCDVPCIVCVYMCTEQLPPGGYAIAVKYIISYHIISYHIISYHIIILVRFLLNLNFLTVIRKFSNIKFIKNSSSGNRVVPCGRTDRHDEANRCFPSTAKAPITYTCVRLYSAFDILVQKMEI